MVINARTMFGPRICRPDYHQVDTSDVEWITDHPSLIGYGRVVDHPGVIAWRRAITS